MERCILARGVRHLVNEPKPWTWLRPRRWLACLPPALLAFSGACSRDLPPAAEPWPVAVSAPGVLGYLSVPADAGLGSLLDAMFGWQPAGLAADLPVGILLLDQRTHAGPLGFLFPTDDPAAFRASLDECPQVGAKGDDGFEFVPSADHPLIQMAQKAARMSTARGPLGVLSAMGAETQLSWAMELSFRGERALLVPAFEAGVAGRMVLEEVPGLSDPGQAHELILSLDVKRIRLAFRNEIASVLAQARGLLLGAQLAGMGQLMARMAGAGSTGPDLGLPVAGPFLWALLEMLGLPDVAGVQLSQRDGAGLVARLMDRAGTTPGASPADSLSGSLRVLWEPGGGLSDVLSTLRPAPEVAGALALAFDPERFPTAFAEWCRPLAELAMGKGPPAEHLLERLAGLLGPLEGWLALGVGEGVAPILSAPIAAGESFDLDGLAEILELLLRSAGGELASLELQGLAGMPTRGNVEAGSYWQRDEVFVLALGSAPLAEVERLAGAVREARVAGAPGYGPVARIEQGGQWLELDTQDGELFLDWTLDAESP